MGKIENIGKYILAETDQTIYKRFPGSQDRETLTAGSTTGKISSWIPSGYYQIQAENGSNSYIKDTAGKIVDTRINAGFFDSIGAGIYDFFGNTGRDVKKTAGFIGEGFKESIGEVKTGFFNINSAIRPILILIVILYALTIIKPLIEKYIGK